MRNLKPEELNSRSNCFFFFKLDFSKWVGEIMFVRENSVLGRDYRESK